MLRHSVRSVNKRGDASRRNGWPQCNALFIHHGKPSPKCSPLFSLHFLDFVCIQGVRCNFGGSPLASCRGGQSVESGEKRAKDEIETGHSIAKTVHGQVATTVCIKAALNNIMIDGDDTSQNGICCISTSTEFIVL